ncbi:hypothetical protein GFL39_05935 [Rhizobium leguminosarum bv. viciae]|uniref:hypothetical protein n=1 Tax=Rhizobium leguminosarum TaxID=384 RepID=UPI0014412F06|nr:hypothetical protein [Rhizobium leguminosarum]NKL04505.1 hypothetical protein [Rhizobium leguminosarum bv. viciae]NKL89669.1 hypothetical protein [Rhizobium leguminosarum bv. viciae]NKM90636.1 hypothetical protein [Rhizobium leguminosarum bv. viciae]
MAVLDRTLPSTRGAVGFELPIFQSRPGANSHIVQKIAPDGTVDRFQSCWLGTQHAIGVGDLDLHVDEGEQAIWTFRNEEQRLIAGTRPELLKYGIEALERDELDDYPIAAAELAAFCECQVRFPRVLQRAFAHLASTSETSAASWRDVSILLPAIKEDVARFFGPKKAGGRHLAQLIAVSNEEGITIYGPKQLVSREVPLLQFRPLAEIFGINSVRFVSFEPTPARPQQLLWQLAGTGGLAGHALTNRPFQGRTRYNQQVGKTETVASGESKERLSPEPELLVRVLGSDLEDVEHANRELMGGGRFRYRHAINVRPMGYGTPRAYKATTSKVFRALSDADMIWVLAAHRLRQTGTPMNGMAGMQTASRTLTLALQALVSSIDFRSQQASFLENLKDKNALGVLGIWRYNSSANVEDNLKRLIFNMLCEDVLLESADYIRVMWPIKKFPVPDAQVIELGQRRYNVDFVESLQSGLGTTLVGFGVDVAPSSNSSAEFRDFCVDLFAGYGWWQVAVAESSITMQRDDKTVRVFPITSARNLARTIPGNPSERERFLVLTNKTVPRSLKNRPYSSSVSVIHYSELGRWLGGVFGDKLVADR